MAELPEIAKITHQMNDELRSRVIDEVIILQEKCTNVSVEELKCRIKKAVIEKVYYKGKWIIIAFTNGENILLSLGMGADVLYYLDEKDSSDKFQIKVIFKDNSCFTIRYWWFGKFLIVSDKELCDEKNTKDIAITPFDKEFTYEYFKGILGGKKTQIKAFLLDQKNVGGIGNMYMHDILFMAKIHPQSKINELTEEEIKCLYDSILYILNTSFNKGSFNYEMDFYGQKGNYKVEDFLIGYKENQDCPICQNPIKLIKTGSTSSFICDSCQKKD